MHNFSAMLCRKKRNKAEAYILRIGL